MCAVSHISYRSIDLAIETKRPSSPRPKQGEKAVCGGKCYRGVIDDRLNPSTKAVLTDDGINPEANGVRKKPEIHPPAPPPPPAYISPISCDLWRTSLINIDVHFSARVGSFCVFFMCFCLCFISALYLQNKKVKLGCYFIQIIIYLEWMQDFVSVEGQGMSLLINLKELLI